MSVLEQAALQHFRVTSIASGETEWVPFVSEAQASVAAQAEHLRSSPSPASTPAPVVLEGKDKEALRQQEGLGLGDGLEKPVIENSPKAPGSGGGGAFRFFQSLDGQRAFLHPLDMKQLMEDFEKGLPLPTRIDAQVCVLFGAVSLRLYMTVFVDIGKKGGRKRTTQLKIMRYSNLMPNLCLGLTTTVERESTITDIHEYSLELL